MTVYRHRMLESDFEQFPLGVSGNNDGAIHLARKLSAINVLASHVSSQGDVDSGAHSHACHRMTLQFALEDCSLGASAPRVVATVTEARATGGGPRLL